mgnify:CR=1 FL=1
MHASLKYKYKHENSLNASSKIKNAILAMFVTPLDLVTYKIDKTHITLCKYEKHIKYKKNTKSFGCLPTSALFKVSKSDFLPFILNE